MSTTAMTLNGNTIVHTYINYEVPAKDGGEEFNYPGTALNYKMDLKSTAHTVNDVRGHESEFEMDIHGFEFHQHTSREKLFKDDDVIKRQHYAEIEELLKQKTGAVHVHPFSHLVRRQTWEKAVEVSKGLEGRASLGFTAPARYAHVDQSYKGALEVLETSFPDCDTTKRWGIINVWRPITAITRDPLGVSDSRSVPESDLFPKTIVLPPKGSGTFENVLNSKSGGFERWAIKSSPKHEWYYQSGMKPDEVMLIKCYDNPKSEKELKPRESIEVRCLVFWDEEAE